jgi:radical SAM superfamily enzyme YgiQ (UPF0313 family)
MRILFIQPQEDNTFGASGIFLAEPLGLEMIAASLNPTHEVKIIDLRIEKQSLEKIIKYYQPDACGISCSFTSDVPRTKKLSLKIKDINPKIFVFVGGHHASLNPQHFFSKNIDAVVLGEGEITTSKMIDALQQSPSKHQLKELKGLAVNMPQTQYITKPSKFLDIKKLPPPKRELVKKYRKFYHFGFATPVYSIETLRGCPYKCNFCSVWKLSGRKLRKKTTTQIITDLTQIPGKSIFFTDDNFFQDKAHSIELAEMIKKNHIKKHYTCQARADTIANNPELMKIWQEIGLKTVFIGLEGINEKTLKDLEKRAKIKENNKAIEILNKLKINIQGSFIVDPLFSQEDFKQLLSYVKSHSISYPSFTILTPLPGTQLYHTKKSEITSFDFRLFDVFHCVLPSRLPLKEFYESFAGLYEQVYSSSKIKLPLLYRTLLGILKGNFRTIKKVFTTFKQLKNPSIYLKAHKVLS